MIKILNGQFIDNVWKQWNISKILVIYKIFLSSE